MEPAKMEQLVSVLERDDIAGALRTVDEYDRWGGLTPEEAAEWRQRVHERQQSLGAGSTNGLR